jgi:hypothetical protein
MKKAKMMKDLLHFSLSLTTLLDNHLPTLLNEMKHSTRLMYIYIYFDPINDHLSFSLLKQYT